MAAGHKKIKDIFYVMDSIEANKVDIPKPEHQEEDSPTCLARTKGNYSAPPLLLQRSAAVNN